MTFSLGTFASPVDGTALATYTWDAVQAPVGVIQVAHGLAEHAGRYDRLAQALTAAGFVVHATDHRGRESISGVPGDFGDAGFEALVADVAAHGASTAAAHPGLPLFLVAHSMGSFAAQSRCSSPIPTSTAGSCSRARRLSPSWAPPATAGAQDPDAPAGLEAFNVGYEQRTGYEWLSRDEAEVDVRRGSAVWFRPSGGDGPGALRGRRDARRPLGARGDPPGPARAHRIRCR